MNQVKRCNPNGRDRTIHQLWGPRFNLQLPCTRFWNGFACGAAPKKTPSDGLWRNIQKSFGPGFGQLGHPLRPSAAAQVPARLQETPILPLCPTVAPLRDKNKRPSPLVWYSRRFSGRTLRQILRLLSWTCDDGTRGSFVYRFWPDHPIIFKSRSLDTWAYSSRFF